MILTLPALIVCADEILGGRPEVVRTLGLSRQRVSDLPHGGPRLRAPHLVRLAHPTALNVCEVLRVGGQSWLADVLEERDVGASPHSRPCSGCCYGGSMRFHQIARSSVWLAALVAETSSDRSAS